MTSAVLYVHLDCSKAFDQVSHPHLLKKIEALDVTGPLLRWFKSYLSGRTLQVRCRYSLSRPFQVTSNVSQGLHLGPSLFTLSINDICDGLKCEDLLLFADDIKIFREVSCVLDQLDLQNDLNSVEGWCRST